MIHKKDDGRIKFLGLLKILFMLFGLIIIDRTHNCCSDVGTVKEPFYLQKKVIWLPFYQRNQFCNGNDDGNQIQKEQPHRSVRTEKRPRHDGHLILETQILGLDEINNKFLMLKFEKSKSGNKFLLINRINYFAKFSGYPKIPVPEDGYAFVRALDELIAELATENFEQKLLQIRDSKSTDEVGDIGNKLKSEMKLKSVEFIGLFHKYQLFLFINNDRGGINQGEICLELFAVHKRLANEDRMFFPLHALPWLRTKMAEMLAKHDGTEKIEKEAPAQIPQKFFQKNVSRTSTLLNGNSSEQKLQQKGRRPQSINKKSKNFQKNRKMSAKMQNFNQIGDIENVNLSSTILSPKMPTNNAIKKKGQDVENDFIDDEVDDELLLDPLVAASGRKMRPLFDFEEDYEEKYRRLAAKRNIPFRY